MARLSVLGVALAVTAVLGSPAHLGAYERVDEPTRSEAVAMPATDAADAADACAGALNTARAFAAHDKKEANRLHSAIGAVIRGDATCAPRVKSWLEVNVCTQAHGVVSSAAFGTNEWPAAWTAELVHRALDRAAAGEPACVEATLPSVEQSANVDPSLADALTRATKHCDGETRDAGWLLLGVVERRARATGNAGLASSVDARIAGELHRRMTKSSGDESADALLEAAGNAGCTACVPDVERALASKEPVTRRIAAGALRFVAEPGAAARACKVLRADASAKVRAHAAWSLGWSRVDLETRADCLRDAALNDADEAVRTDAARAIEQLIDETNSMEDEGA